MPVTQLDLEVDLALNNAFDTLYITDITPAYNVVSEPFGYGSPNGVAINDVTGLVLTVNYTQLQVSAVYTFTIINGTITAATINFNGLGAQTILSQLNSTTFPLNGFMLLNSYTYGSSQVYNLPSLVDGAYGVIYNITGSASVSGTPTAFDLSTTDMILQKLATQCCMDEIFNKVDIDCDSKEANKAILSQSYLSIAESSVKNEDYVKANLFINKAKSLCDCGCGC